MSGMSPGLPGCISDEYTMKRAPAKWVADNPAAYDNGIRQLLAECLCEPVGYMEVYRAEIP